MIRNIIYAVIVLAVFAGAVLDARAGDWKSAIVAGMFGVVNATIFFWRG